LDANGAVDDPARRVECHHEAVAARLDLLSGIFSIRWRTISLCAFMIAWAAVSAWCWRRLVEPTMSVNRHGRRLGHATLDPQGERPFRALWSTG
jgi:hypothetical protein